MRILELALKTSDSESLGRFYGGVLGLPIESNADTNSLTVVLPDSKFIFEQESGFDGRYHFAFNIPANKIEAAAKFLTDRKVELLPAEDGGSVFRFESWKAHSVYFYDPAGNIVELIARHELYNASSEPQLFGARDILSISEIGVAAVDVAELRVAVEEQTGAVPYRESSETFCALGDAEGLIILVADGRVWYPNTGVSASRLPVRMVVRDDCGACHRVQIHAGRSVFERD